MSNRYFVCSRLRPPVEFDIAEDRPADDAEIAYFIRIFRILERQYGLDGYTVCFAWSSLSKLPRIGPDVIAVVYGDEHCRIPPYVHGVGAVIKCHGFFPMFPHRRCSLRLMQIEVAEFVRNLVLWLPTGWRWAFCSGARRRCHLVPVGYGLPTDVEPVPFDDRPYLASFFGSVTTSAAQSLLRSIVGTPKAYCRTVMLRQLRQLQNRYGHDLVKLGLTGGFQESIQEAGRTYFDIMARTKICLAPRGTARETLRLCEGLRFGCIVIADRLPPHSFYQNSPIIQINDWRSLPTLVAELGANSSWMRELHERGKRYWRDVLSEYAIAGWCASALRPSDA